MAGTFEAKIALLNHAAQVRTGQARDFEAIFIVYDNSGDMGQYRAAPVGIIRCGADVEFIGGGGSN